MGAVCGGTRAFVSVCATLRVDRRCEGRVAVED
jgi:hypothetical protein